MSTNVTFLYEDPEPRQTPEAVALAEKYSARDASIRAAFPEQHYRLIRKLLHAIDAVEDRELVRWHDDELFDEPRDYETCDAKVRDAQVQIIHEACTMSKYYRWVPYNGTFLNDIGINSDGTLHNPRGYPGADVRAALSKSRGIEKAVETRRRRQKKIHEIVARSLANHPIGPRSHCAICKRHLDDPQSIERGMSGMLADSNAAARAGA